MHATIKSNRGQLFSAMEIDWKAMTTWSAFNVTSSRVLLSCVQVVRDSLKKKKEGDE